MLYSILSSVFFLIRNALLAMTSVQVVLGSAGSGKTTYCRGAKEFFMAINRQCAIINLDPSNDLDIFSAEFDVDVRGLVDAFAVASMESLGPNGALLWALQHVLSSIDWLLGEINRLVEDKPDVLLIDCPGQVELYSSSSLMPRILNEIRNAFEFPTVVISMLDSVYCSSITTFIAASCISLSIMVSLDYPFFMVFSKSDLLEASSLHPALSDYFNYGTLSANSSGYPSSRSKRILACLADFLESNQYFTHHFLSIQDKGSVSALMAKIDGALG